MNKKAQGTTRNKLVITWKDYTPSSFGTERESFKCNSEIAAEKILSKRTQNRIFFAKWFNAKGEFIMFNINTKDSILSI